MGGGGKTADVVTTTGEGEAMGRGGNGEKKGDHCKKGRRGKEVR